MVFLNLESENEWWKEENEHGDEMNQKSASKLLSEIGNPRLMVEMSFLGFVNMEM